MASGLERILKTYEKVARDGYLKPQGLGLGTYAVSNFRGGVGKSSITFNLAYELSRTTRLLLADVCPQQNLTELFLDNSGPPGTIHDALRAAVLGSAFGEMPEDLAINVKPYCGAFTGGKGCFIVPGDPKLFAFPSALYQQLQIAGVQSKAAIPRLLKSLDKILKAEAARHKLKKILIDTSPFYAGGTHLAWCAADALIIPVRVDEHSIESLALTLGMLSDPGSDFHQWNERAGITDVPKVAAVVMTMVGSKGGKRYQPDAASQMFINRALALAEKHHTLFPYKDPAEAFVLLDDFMSAGRVSGAKSMPIATLTVGSFHTIDGKRLQVNKSADRYKREVAYLASLF